MRGGSGGVYSQGIDEHSQSDAGEGGAGVHGSIGADRDHDGLGGMAAP